MQSWRIHLSFILETSIDFLQEREPHGYNVQLIQEVTTLLAGFGYALNQGGSGSRARFEHEHCAPVFMHKPHPSPALKPYQIDQVLDILRQEGLL